MGELGFPEHCWHWVGGQLQCCWCGLYQAIGKGREWDGHGGYYVPNMVSLGIALRCYGRPTQ